jgi:hypothetical protein
MLRQSGVNPARSIIDGSGPAIASAGRATHRRKMEMETLPDYLFEPLLEALRRDMRRQELEATRGAGGTQDALYHGFNVRLNREILQHLRPKQLAGESAN